MDYHVWETMLEVYHRHHPKPKTIVKLKNVAVSMGQEPTDVPLKEFKK